MSDILKTIFGQYELEDRGTFLPIGTTKAGNPSLAVPGFLMEGYQGAANHLTGKHGMVTDPNFDTKAAAGDAFLAGSAVGGPGALAPKPRGAIGMFGGGRAPERVIGIGQPDAPRGVEAYHWSPKAGQISPENQFRPGSHFGTKRAAADRMRDVMDEPAPPTNAGATMPVQLDIQNPLRVDDLNLDSPSRLAWAIEKELNLPGLKRMAEAAEAKALQGDGSVNDVYAAIDDVLRHKGYDGLTYRNVYEDPGSISYVATRPGTVRSSITGETLFSKGAPPVPPPSREEPSYRDILELVAASPHGGA